MKWQKIMGAALATVLCLSCLSLPAFAVEMDLVDNNRLPDYPEGPAPEMHHVQEVGPLTISNVVSYEYVDNFDAFKNPIKVYYVIVGPSAMVKSNHDHTDFIYYWSGEWNTDNTAGYMTTDRASYTEFGADATISDWDIDAYRSAKLDDGTWSAGLAWNFDFTDVSSAAFTAKIDGVSYYYFLGGRQAPVYPDSKPETPVTPPAATATAVPTSSTVYVNGKAVKFESYTINGNNYFKLRDLAQVLRGTNKQFEVTWNSSLIGHSPDGFVDKGGVVELTSNTPYTTVGGELNAGDGKTKTCNLSTSNIMKDGILVYPTAYMINGNNYFKLRDIGQIFDFGVEWDGSRNAIMIDTNKVYTSDK